MPKKRHPELEGFESQPLYTFELKSQKKTFQNRMFWTSIGLTIGVCITTSAYFLSSTNQPLNRLGNQGISQVKDSFTQGLTQAMNAAELTQTAEFQEDWSRVAVLWQQAINQMRSVGSSHPNYDLAQQKIAEYDRNLRYAQSNVKTRISNNSSEPSFWTLGSDRDLVIGLQGMPERVIQYDTSCKEVLYFGDSVVELRNGYVTEYTDLEGNLNVLADEQAAFSTQAAENTWTLGSSKEDVFKVQGTPTRTSAYQDAVTLHYGESTVDLENDRVIGYADLDENLSVSANAVLLPQNAALPSTWSLGSSRADVLLAEQKTPTAVNRHDKSCEEVFQFDESTVTFRKGHVSEYSNFSQNLNIQ